MITTKLTTATGNRLVPPTIEIAMDSVGCGEGSDRRLDADVRHEESIRRLIKPWGLLFRIGFYGFGTGTAAYVVELDSAASEIPMRAAFGKAGVIVGMR